MDIRQLNYFVQVADCGSYSLASQKLFISQPALSKAIKNIEDEMGFSFFYTYQRRQRLTDKGQAFYDKVVKLLANYEELIQLTYLEAEIDKGHVSVGLSTAAGPALFAHIFPVFRKAFPQITFSVMEKETNVLKEAVMRKDLDAAYVDMSHVKEVEDTDNFEIYWLTRSDIVIVTNADSPLAQLNEARYTDLAGHPMIMFSGGKDFSNQVEGDMKEWGVKPEVVLASNQWNFIMDMIAGGMGYVLAPYYIYEKFKNPKLSCVLLDENTRQRDIALITKKGEYRSRACANFLAFASKPESYEGIPHLHNVL